MSPEFDSSIIFYSAIVPNATSSITISPSVTNSNSTIRVNGSMVDSGESTADISLVVGVNIITIDVTAHDGSLITTYVVEVIRAGSYESWKDNVFSPSDRADPSVSGELASPAGDGITNLMKYALGLAPMSSGLGSLPTLSSDSGYLTLTYRKSKQAAGLTFTVEAGNSLEDANWETVTEVTSQTDVGDHWLVTVRDNVPHSSQAKRFMRLKVVMPPVVIDTGNLQILEALYGAQGGIADVKSIVEGNIQNDMVNMRVGNAAFGDPSPGFYKSLFIRYQNESGQYEANIRENLMLQIPDANHTKIQ